MNLRAILLSVTALAGLAPAAIAERGSDGHVNLMYWQAPSILNPYLSAAVKDVEPASLVLEPLGRFDQDGGLVPYLAQEIPTVENGGVSADLRSITLKLKTDLTRSDGTAVTAADVKFTAEYCMHPAGGCAQLARFEGVSMIETIDDLTLKVTFSGPKPNPYLPFMGGQSPILQKAQFQDCLGDKALQCTDQNFGPIGTGPFVVDGFRVNDVISMSANPYYRDPAKPAFATLTLKGGGDATQAGRAVLQTGEFDYAWNLQLSPDVLKNMEKDGKGKVVAAFGPAVERLEMNLTNSSDQLPEGERSTAQYPHPILSDIRVRKALSKAINRNLLVEIGYGPTGRATCNLVPAPALYASDNTECLEQDVEGARALLDAAGWIVGPNGVREKDGRPLRLLYQTSTNAVRQEVQDLVKHWWNDIGVQTELRNVPGSVFFSSDPGSPDTYLKFYADVQMYANLFHGTDPEAYLAEHTCEKAPRPETQWVGANINRFCDPEYDALIAELGQTGERSKRGEIGKKLNDMLTKDSYVVVPLVHRGRVSGHANSLGGVIMNSWDSELWNIADWYRIQ
jgi:peptide/nickel transport system substrate-binding protein